MSILTCSIRFNGYSYQQLTIFSVLREPISLILKFLGNEAKVQWQHRVHNGRVTTEKWSQIAEPRQFRPRSPRRVSEMRARETGHDGFLEVMEPRI